MFSNVISPLLISVEPYLRVWVVEVSVGLLALAYQFQDQEIQP